MRFQSEISVFKFLRRSVDGKHLMRFQSEISVFKFLRRSVDGKHLMRFQSKISVFKFLPRSVDGSLVNSLLAHTSAVLSRASVQLDQARVHLFVADFDRLCEMRPLGKVEERKVIMLNFRALVVLKYKWLKQGMCQCIPAKECLRLYLVIKSKEFISEFSMPLQRYRIKRDFCYFEGKRRIKVIVTYLLSSIAP